MSDTQSEPESVPSCSSAGAMSMPSASTAPAKYFAFCLNNYNENDWNLFKGLDCSNVPILVFQEELAPTTGTPHIQGAVMFLKKVRPLKMFQRMGFSNEISWKKRKTLVVNGKMTKQWAATDDEFFGYCCRESKRAPNGRVYTRGYSPTYMKWVQEIPELYTWEEKIINILNSPSDARTIHWFWEPQGAVGKTTFLKYIYTHFDNVVISGGKLDDMKNCIASYVKINKIYPKVVIINYERHESIDYCGIKCTKDMFFYSGKYEGAEICGPCPIVIIMANTPPNESRLSEGVFSITKIS